MLLSCENRGRGRCLSVRRYMYTVSILCLFLYYVHVRPASTRLSEREKSSGGVRAARKVAPLVNQSETVAATSRGSAFTLSRCCFATNRRLCCRRTMLTGRIALYACQGTVFAPNDAKRVRTETKILLVYSDRRKRRTFTLVSSRHCEFLTL